VCDGAAVVAAVVAAEVPREYLRSPPCPLSQPRGQPAVWSLLSERPAAVFTQKKKKEKHLSPWRCLNLASSMSLPAVGQRVSDNCGQNAKTERLRLRGTERRAVIAQPPHVTANRVSFCFHRVLRTIHRGITNIISCFLFTY